MDDLARRIRIASKLSGNFTLRSGRVSDTYFDKYRFESDPRIVQKIRRHSSGCGPMVVAEHSAEALAALNRVMGQGSDGCGLRNSVAQALMIALGVVVRHELPDCVLKRCRSEEDHPVQTLLFN